MDIKILIIDICYTNMVIFMQFLCIFVWLNVESASVFVKFRYLWMKPSSCSSFVYIYIDSLTLLAGLQSKIQQMWQFVLGCTLGGPLDPLLIFYFIQL